MAVFTTTMPQLAGNAAADTIALRSWACRLISELRCVLYSLDKENVKMAGSVMAEDIIGVIGEDKLPEISVNKLYGRAELIEVNGENGILFNVTNENGKEELAAEIYYQPDGEKKGLHINSSSIFVNGGRLI